MPKILTYDLGGTKLSAALIDELGQISVVKTHSICSFETFNQLIELLIDWAKEFKASDPSVNQAVIASAGPIDPKRGVLLRPTNLKHLSDQAEVPLLALVKERLPELSWAIENDANAALRAEIWRGQLKHHENALVVTLGTGIGVAALVEGKVFRSAHGLHPELGHLKLSTHKLNMAPFNECGCGVRGCIEASLSGTHFTAWFKSKWSIQEPLNGETLIEMAAQNDQRALNSFEIYSDLLAEACEIYWRIFYPETIVFAGGFSRAARFFLERTQSQLKASLSRPNLRALSVPELLLSDLPDHAGLLGAAALGFQTAHIEEGVSI